MEQLWSSSEVALEQLWSSSGVAWEQLGSSSGVARELLGSTLGVAQEQLGRSSGVAQEQLRSNLDKIESISVVTKGALSQSISSLVVQESSNTFVILSPFKIPSLQQCLFSKGAVSFDHSSALRCLMNLGSLRGTKNAYFSLLRHTLMSLINEHESHFVS